MSLGSKKDAFSTMMYAVSKHDSWWNAWFLLGRPKVPRSSALAEGGATSDSLVLLLLLMSLPTVVSRR